ncbi:Mhp366/Mhp367 family surface (lipo)protein [Mycoplasma sp. 'Moose RK']|uniref:Mhp366/Mhp367 family surface (lipo)protein n=1 Tax=Mycoplasma sp. 'Moose RK' TaxID=2780095 RepID=UPI001E59FD4D|nr:hypothetical protein [Mycoplasma sp. 'Moose RK']
MLRRKKKYLFLGLVILAASGIGAYFGYVNFFSASTTKISGLKLVIDSTKNKQKDLKKDTNLASQIAEYLKFSKYYDDLNQENEDLIPEYGQRESYFSWLSRQDLKKIKQNQITFPAGYENFNFNTENGFVTKESNEKFLGEENDNLLVYDLNYPQISSLITEKEPLKSNILNQKFTIFDVKARNQIFKLDKIGVYAEPIESSKYDKIYQKNVKFKTGTATILDATSGQALLITNNHVIKSTDYNQKVDNNLEIKGKKMRFWNTLGGNFFEWYENGKIHSMNRDDIALLFYAKKVFQEKIKQFEENAVLEYLINFFSDYFSIPTDFDNNKFDVGIFYFNYSKFNQDLKELAEFYSKNKTEFLAKVQQDSAKQQANPVLLTTKIDEFLSSYQKFIDFWEKMKQEKPVKISPKVWKKGDSSYDLNVGLFWPKANAMKNNFKGVYATDPQENFARLSLYFYTNNGPGASGSGVFNKDGELQFINAFGLINNFYDNATKVEKNYYDKLNTNISLSGGVPLVTENFNLAKIIKKFYPSNGSKVQYPIEKPEITVTKIGT